MKSFIRFVILASIIIGCNGKSTIVVENAAVLIKYELVAKDTIQIPLDNMTGHELHHPQYYIDQEENEFLITFNSSLNRIYMFDLRKKTLHKVLRIPEIGPKTIGKISGYYYLNHDSIFLEKSRSAKIYLVDSALNTSHIYPTNSLDVNGTYSTKLQPMQYMDNKLYLLAQNYQDDNKPSFYIKSGMTQILDLNSGRESKHRVGYPEMYRQGEIYGVSLSSGNLTLAHGGYSYASFNTDDQIYKYTDTELVLTKSVPSKKVKINPIPIQPHDDENFDKYTKILAKSASYHILRHDPYHNLLYRWVVFPSDEYKDPITGEINFGRNKPFSIQIIDEELNQVGEVEFPRYTYDFLFGMVPTPHGLLFNMYHPLNEEVEEDVLKFVIFEVKKKEE
jgi:hypothetical protein